jgi:hypothetical protein
MFPFAKVPGTTEEERNRAYQKRLEELRLNKLIDLLQHYGKAPPEKYPWYMLAYRLACDFVPGMKVINRLPRRGRPRQRWGIELEYRLYDEIEAIKAERPRTSTSAAIELARERNPNDWGRYQPKTLETRYYELQKKRQVVQVMQTTGLLGALFPSSSPRK